MQEEEDFKKPGKVRKAVRGFFKILLFALLLPVTLALSLQIPFVQTAVLKYIVNKLSTKTETHIEISRVHLNIFQGLELHHFYAGDENHTDTLIYIDKVSFSLAKSLFSLYRGKLFINEFIIDGSVLRIIKEQGEIKTNLAVFIERLTKADPGDQNASELIDIKLEVLRLKNIKLSIDNFDDGSFTSIQLSEASIIINSLDLENGLIDIFSIHMDNPQVEVIRSVGDFQEKEKAYNPSDTLVKEETKKFSPVVLIEKLKINNGLFSYNNKDKAIDHRSNMLDYHHFEFSDINVEAECLFSGGQEWILEWVTVGFKDNKGFQLENMLARDLILNQGNLQIPTFEFKTSNTNFNSSVSFIYDSFDDFKNFTTHVYLNLDLNPSRIFISDILYFVSGLETNPFFQFNKNRIIDINGSLRGYVDNLSGQKMSISIGNGFDFKGNFGTRNLTKSSNTLLNLKVESLRSSVRFLKEVIPGFNPPDNFYKLGRFTFRGGFDGFFKDFVANGSLISELGQANLDMRLDVKQGNEKAFYSGEITLINFDLGKWSDNPDIDKVTFNATVKDGRGLTLNTAFANLNANMESFTYKSYTYKDMVLNGILEENRFSGTFISNDENLELDFDGNVSYIDSILIAEVNAKIGNIDLYVLGLNKSPLSVKGNIDVNLKGKLPDELTGSAKIEDITIIADTTYFIENLLLYTYTLSGNESYLEISSDFGEARIEGIYNFTTIIPQFKFLLKDNYPYHTRNWDWPQIVTYDNDFEFNIDLMNSSVLLEIAGIEDLAFQNLKSKGNFNSSNDELGINFQIEKLTYKNNSFNDIDINIENTRSNGFLSLNIDSTLIGNKPFNPIYVETYFEQDTVRFNVSTDKIIASIDTLELGASLTPHARGYQVNIQDRNWKMFGEDWTVFSENELVFGSDYIRVSDLLISDGYREIELMDIDNRGIGVSFKRFNFLILNDIIAYEKIVFSGEGEGRVRVDNILGDETNISANVTIEDFRLNDEQYGILDLSFDKSADSSFEALISLSKEAQTIKTNVRYDTKTDSLNGSLRGRNFPLPFFEYIIQSGISETKGTANLDAEVFGTLKDIKLRGEGLMMNGGVKIDYLGSSFFFDNQKMQISETFLDFTGAVISDMEGNTGTLRGGLRHNVFEDFTLDVSMASDRAVIINTTKFDNPIYYGYGKGRIDVAFSGTFESTNITVNAVTGPGTVINIPVSASETGYEESFITFINREDILGPGSLNGDDAFRLEGLNLDMNLTVTEDAQINIIFNERLGDVVKGIGRGNLQILLRRTGEFEIYGDYEVDQGEYLFTAWNIAAKPFIVRRGGKIRWTGDPLNAELSIKADYQVRAPLTIFLDEFLATSPGSIAAQEARNRQNINLILDLGGTLFSPSVKFDIEFPGLTGELNSFAQSKLRTLRTNEVALNSQVLGLLVFNTFLPNNNPISSNIFGSTQVVEAGISTLSEFVSSQLSQLLTGLLQEALAENGLIAGIDFEIGLRKNSAFFSDQTNADLYPDEIEVHLKNRFRFLDERLSLGAGVNYVRQSPLLLATDYYIPDFVVEYFLTDDRRLKLRFYGRYDIDEISQQAGRRQRYGLGIGYRREFGSLTDIKSDFSRTAQAIQQIDQ